MLRELKALNLKKLSYLNKTYPIHSLLHLEGKRSRKMAQGRDAALVRLTVYSTAAGSSQPRSDG